MIAFFLLICVSGVGVLGVAAITSTEWKRFRQWREARVRNAAFALDRPLRQTQRPTLKPTPQRNVVVPQRVADLTGVIARLEESAQFSRVPAPPPRRMPKGTASPPVPQMYPVIATPAHPIAVRPPPIPALRRR